MDFIGTRVVLKTPVFTRPAGAIFDQAQEHNVTIQSFKHRQAFTAAKART